MIKISVVISTFNKFNSLYLTLKSYCHVEFDKNEFEVIVCDDGSERGDFEELKEFESYINLHVNRLPHKGRSAARNSGIKQAKGELIIFSDDDTLVDSMFLDIHWKNYRQYKDMVYLGQRKQIYHKADLEERMTLCRIEEFDMVFQEAIENAKKDIYSDQTRELLFANGRSKHWLCCTTGNMSISKDLLTKVDGFDEEFTGWGMEDIELGYRLFLNRAQFIFLKDALNYHMEHKRNRESIIQEMQNNMIHFYNKYEDKELLSKFWDFYRGEISLKQFDRVSYQEIDSNNNDSNFVLFKRSKLGDIENILKQN